ncbi:hypothetical protein QBC36DRAFT_346772 [Triangularia setosa]|uniref:Uncharacterized protein n=1 Tax=Triangularia setosa TaxID=2587417 RepID=A0AAN7A766_9PEZI|nr:hypothetical protein QBC36DRAFT_346772 [Podospora setosa]
MKPQTLLTTFLLTATSVSASPNAKDGIFPQICTKPCRNALHVANAVQGWDRRLCAPGSEFMSYKFECWACITIAGGGTTRGTEFDDVGRWCGEYLP